MARGGGWVVGEAARGGGEGGRRCECFLLSAKREQEKDKWRGECFAARLRMQCGASKALAGLWGTGEAPRGAHTIPCEGSIPRMACPGASRRTSRLLSVRSSPWREHGGWLEVQWGWREGVEGGRGGGEGRRAFS